MGKGRSRYGSERLLHPASHHVAVAVAADRLADLDEEDVWSVLAAPPAEPNRSSRQPEQDRPGRWAAGGLSMAFDARSGAAPTPAGRHHHQHHHVAVAASSAPVKVPEWAAASIPGGEQEYGYRESSEEGEWMAPHEYVQARSGGRGATTASVFEGVGRTLKGRDLSRVRDAVWSNTGFFG